jgi:hypothetical protein
MLDAKQGMGRARMDLNEEVRAVMGSAEKAMTVNEVVDRIADRIRNDVRDILNGLTKDQVLQSVRGGGGHETHYHLRPMKRRF